MHRACRAVGQRARVLALVLVGGTACHSGGTPAQPAPDGGGADVGSPRDQTEAVDATAAQDGSGEVGVPDGDATGGAADAGVECAPAPAGGDVPAGAAPMQAAGPAVASTTERPELTELQAQERFTIQKVLAQGGVLSGPGSVTPSTATPDAGAAQGTPLSTAEVTCLTKDDWNPQARGIGDPKTFTPTFTVAPDGSGTHKTIGAALVDANQLGLCGRVYVRLLKGEYREQVLLPSKTSAPAITLYSTEPDARDTRIVAGVGAPMVGSMSASATLTVRALSNFQMKNLSVVNEYVPGAAAGTDQSGVALLVQSDRAQFENVRFIGRLGTLYVKSREIDLVARTYFRDCYVEGDQDLVIGRGTAVFDHTELRSLASGQVTGGTIAAPSTLVYAGYGFLFESCAFTGEDGASGSFLGRQWYEGENVGAVGKMIVRNSTLGAHIAAAPWSSAGGRTSTPKNPAGTVAGVIYTSSDFFPAGSGPEPAEPFLGEYRNSGPGAHRELAVRP